MDVYGTMLQPRLKNYSKAGAKIEPQDVIEILHGIDLTDLESMLQYFPLVEGKGKEAIVPLSILGISPDPAEVFKAIRNFRKMNEMEQKHVPDIATVRSLKAFYETS